MARLGIEMLAISEMTEFLVSPGPATSKKVGDAIATNIKSEVEKIKNVSVIFELCYVIH